MIKYVYKNKQAIWKKPLNYPITRRNGLPSFSGTCYPIFLIHSSRVSSASRLTTSLRYVNDAFRTAK